MVSSPSGEKGDDAALLLLQIQTEKISVGVSQQIGQTLVQAGSDDPACRLGPGQLAQNLHPHPKALSGSQEHGVFVEALLDGVLPEEGDVAPQTLPKCRETRLVHRLEPGSLHSKEILAHGVVEPHPGGQNLTLDREVYDLPVVGRQPPVQGVERFSLVLQGKGFVIDPCDSRVPAGRR